MHRTCTNPISLWQFLSRLVLRIWGNSSKRFEIVKHFSNMSWLTFWTSLSVAFEFHPCHIMGLTAGKNCSHKVHVHSVFIVQNWTKWTVDWHLVRWHFTVFYRKCGILVWQPVYFYQSVGGQFWNCPCTNRIMWKVQIPSSLIYWICHFHICSCNPGVSLLEELLNSDPFKRYGLFHWIFIVHFVIKRVYRVGCCYWNDF